MSDMVNLFKQMAVQAVEANKPVDIFFGVVKSVSPLEIQTDQKIILPESVLVLTDNVRDIQRDITVSMLSDNTIIDELYHKHSYGGSTSTDTYENSELNISYTHKHSYSGNTDYSGSKEEISHNHTITGKKKIIIHNSLNVGETVMLLRCSCGQRYVVLDRVNDWQWNGEWIDDT